MKYFCLGIRNRLGRGQGGDPNTDPDQEPDEEVIEEDQPVPWTKLDWIILAVKALIWFCFQVIFAKVKYCSKEAATRAATVLVNAAFCIHRELRTQN